MQFITAGLRVFQLIFTIIVLALSVKLAKGQEVGSVPAETGYAAFTGGFGILAAIVGIAALFVDSLDGLVTMVLDGVSGLALLAGGIVYAVRLRGTSCSDYYTTWDNVLLNGGCIKLNSEDFVRCAYTKGQLKPRCTSATADAAFMFLGFVMCVAVVGASFVFRGRR
ncbi:uncharacterized protein N7515_006762 [Penicillium bovifimosum]|uniref:MARVEL domain-containing protein n=1 Tax=Penicillium bovifimosum TaxID=126998 RepID=A0A9W9GVJ0_9EURO|nr:uncharacterized protein N7515_006762 [Penicillium bovifimosum]KAJ5130723.1 hypothetical protein N7515_006762 [Penicillium bovifimosum]